MRQPRQEKNNVNSQQGEKGHGNARWRFRFPVNHESDQNHTPDNQEEHNHPEQNRNGDEYCVGLFIRENQAEMILLLRSKHPETRGRRIKGDPGLIRQVKCLRITRLQNIVDYRILPVNLYQCQHLIPRKPQVHRDEPSVAVEYRLVRVKMFLIDYREGNAVVRPVCNMPLMINQQGYSFPVCSAAQRTAEQGCRITGISDLLFGHAEKIPGFILQRYKPGINTGRAEPPLKITEINNVGNCCKGKGNEQGNSCSPDILQSLSHKTIHDDKDPRH